MSSSSYHNGIACEALINEELTFYYVIIAASLSFTVLVHTIYYCCLATRIQGAPGLAANYWGLAAAIKALLGVVIAVLATPTCPTGCDCQYVSFPPVYLYPAFAMLVAAAWARRAYQHRQQALQVAGADGDGHDKEAVFDAIPTSETEMT